MLWPLLQQQGIVGQNPPTTFTSFVENKRRWPYHTPQSFSPSPSSSLTLFLIQTEEEVTWTKSDLISLYHIFADVPVLNVYPSLKEAHCSQHCRAWFYLLRLYWVSEGISPGSSPEGDTFMLTQCTSQWIRPISAISQIAAPHINK